MSDPVSNVEIEDVLSSIRRLVSDDHRAGARKPRAEDRPETGGDRLVLTPALRVAEAEEQQDDQAHGDPADGAEDGGNTVVEGTDDPAPLRLGPEDMSALPAQDGDDVNDGSGGEDIAESAESQPGAEPGDKAEPELPGAGPVGDGDNRTDLSDAPWHDPQATLYEAAERAGGPDTDEGLPQQAGTELPADPEADDTDTSAVTGSESDTDAPQDQTDDAPFPLFFRSARDDEYEEDQAPVEWEGPAFEMPDIGTSDLQGDLQQAAEHPDEPAEPVTLSTKIEALEAAIARRKDQWEPDGNSDEDYAGTRVETIQWQDHDAAAEDDAAGAVDDNAPDISVTVEAVEEPETDSVGAAEPDDTPEDGDGLDALDSEDAVLDEESLRELVADIVREELQGALGERITRNVRKLVRREIHRALTAQELD